MSLQELSDPLASQFHYLVKEPAFWNRGPVVVLYWDTFLTDLIILYVHPSNQVAHACSSYW